MKLSDSEPFQRKLVIAVFKASQLYPKMLSGFEQEFINETIPRYAKFGLDINIEGKQWIIFNDIALKLYLEEAIPNEA